MNNIIAFINKAMQEKLNIFTKSEFDNFEEIEVYNENKNTGISFIRNDKTIKIKIIGDGCGTQEIVDISNFEMCQFSLLYETVNKYRESKFIDEFNSFFNKTEEKKEITNVDDLNDDD